MIRNVLFALTAGISMTAAAQEEVRIYNWSDYVGPETISDFETQTGIKVIYEEFESNERLDEALRANEAWDVIFPSDNFFAGQMRDGLLSPLNKRKLPNYYANLDRAFLATMQTDLDPGNRYGLPYMWGTTGIAYNIEAVKAVMGSDFEFSSWTQLFDVNVARRLQSCGVNFLDSPDEMMPLALLAVGASPSGYSDAEFEQATALVQRVSRYVTFKLEDFEADLIEGNTCVTVAWNGDLMAALDEVDNPTDYNYVVPEEGSILWIDMVTIPHNAQNVEAAHTFINYLLEGEVNAKIVNYVAYPSAVRAATPFIDEDIASNTVIFPSSEERRRLVIPAPDTVEQANRKLAAWRSIRGADWVAE